LELVHIDLCGPTRTKSIYGENYFMLIIGDYIRMTLVYFLKEKLEAFEKFKTYKVLIENETDLKIKCMRLDNEGEFTSKEFIKFFENHGIKRRFLAPRTPLQNGVVERKNKKIQEVARTMLNETKIQDKFWRDAICTKVHKLNRAQLRPNHDKTPYEIWFGRPSYVKHFRVFGRNVTLRMMKIILKSLIQDLMKAYF
jgi:transposase InsO family protein